jgi:protease-4
MVQSPTAGFKSRLARISHQPPAASADRSASQGRAPSGLLDILLSMPASASVRAALIYGPLRALATESGEKCGLAALRSSTISLATLAAVLILATSGCVLVSGSFDPFSRQPKPLREHVVAGQGRAKILLVDVTRVISNESERGPFGLASRESVVARIDAELRQAAKDDAVRGVIVRINSPGGTVTASDVLYHQLTRFKNERRVPVVAQLMDVAASGGYYAALAADEIIAHPTSVTGSVGVLFQGVSLEGLLGKVGVTNQTIKSGDKKDIGSPLRTMTAEERALLEQLLAEMRGRFLALVRERRPLVTDAAEGVIADGRIFTASQALELGMIDAIGYLDEAAARVKARAGVSEARLVLYRRADEPAETPYSVPSSNGGLTPQISLFGIHLDTLLGTPQFLYLWAP